MALCIAPPSGSCEGKEEDKLTIQRDFVIEDKGRLTAYHGPGGEVTIPEGVLKIGEGAFAGCAVLTGVTVPEGAEEIEKDAFLGCAGLRRVTLPVGLARIGKCAFKDCVSLEEIHFPKGLCQIGESAFAGCVRLKEAMLPEGLIKLPKPFGAGAPEGACVGGIRQLPGLRRAYPADHSEGYAPGV